MMKQRQEEAVVLEVTKLASQFGADELDSANCSCSGRADIQRNRQWGRYHGGGYYYCNIWLYTSPNTSPNTRSGSKFKSHTCLLALFRVWRKRCHLWSYYAVDFNTAHGRQMHREVCSRFLNITFGSIWLWMRPLLDDDDDNTARKIKDKKKWCRQCYNKEWQEKKRYIIDGKTHVSVYKFKIPNKY